MASILITGASGFLGSILSNSLSKIYEVITLSRYNSDIRADLGGGTVHLPQVDIVIHAAGRAHLTPRSELQKQDFFKVNVEGTKNLLLSLQNSGLPQSFVFVSSVAVYGLDSGLNINESHSLKAQDPYGRSKIFAEELVTQWCLEHKVTCSILRLPLIAAQNPPGNLKAMINAIKKGYYLNIAGGKTRKSVVLAHDVAKIIPVVVKIGGIYNLTDGLHPTFAELSASIAKQLDRSEPISIPSWLAKGLATIGDTMGIKAPINSEKLKKIMCDLTFDDSKARTMLGWSPTSVVKGFRI